MRIEAVTACIDYADLLSVTAPWNRPLFDRWVIVTCQGDHPTRELCRKYNLEVIITEDHKKDGSAFNKGRIVERGLQHLSTNDVWRVHLDADIVLPSNFRHYLDAAQLSAANIYGMDRVMVETWEQWQVLKNSGYLQEQHDYHYRVRFPEGCKVGSRWSHPVEGWVPIGFFQLWHSSQDEWSGIKIRPYPRHHNSACRSDVQHGLQWDRRNRILIPEMIAIHLGKDGVNWNGRKSHPFTPCVPS